MIELSAPAVLRDHRPELFAVKGFTCPECEGNGWVWGRDEDAPDADCRGWAKKSCPTCGGTGELDAEVTVNWKKQDGGTGSENGNQV